MPTTTTTITTATATAPDNSPLFFWGHNLLQNGMDAYFSNWYPSPFKDVNGQKYSDIEMWMMYKKAKLFKDDEMAKKILTCWTNPVKSKSYGRKVKNFDQIIWDTHAKKIVYEGLLLKFDQNKKMKKHLLSTNDRLLVEASPYDKIWGIGIRIEKAKNTPQALWPGNNWLGQCLVQARNKLRSMK